MKKVGIGICLAVLVLLTWGLALGSAQARAPGDEVMAQTHSSGDNVMAASQALSDHELQQVTGKFALTLYYPPTPIIFNFAPNININIVPPNSIRPFFRPINISITHRTPNPT
jgi:hypothetical protein